MNINDLFQVVDSDSEFQGMHRLLWINRGTDVAVTIAVPTLVPNPGTVYFRAPITRSLAAIEASYQSGKLRPARLELPGLMLMSDEEIADRYPSPTGDIPASVLTRESYFKAIEPIVNSYTQDRRAFFEDSGMTKEIVKVIDFGSLKRNQVYPAVHRYLAIAIGKNALLALRYSCGGPGKEREQTSPLGNTTKAFKAGLSDSKGFVVKKDDKERLAWGWLAFLDGLNSVEDAYNLTMGVYYSDGTHVEHGVELPSLLPADQRPTQAQFERWGSRGDGNRQAWETFLCLNEMETDYRALTGTALDGISAVGQVAMCDATSADQQLVTDTSRLKPIGSATQLLVQDAFTSIISGLYLGLEAPSGQIALLSVLYSAMDCVELCRLYGIESQPDDIPALFYGTYLVDNGEFRTQYVIKTLRGVGSGIEFTASYHGDLKGPVEAAHRSTHKLVGHKASGTTLGRQRKRGEVPPALKASWRFHEAMRIRLMAIIYFNTEMRVERFFNAHPLASAMKRDGIPPIRKAIYQWCVRNGYVETPPFHEDKLRAALLPEINAVVRENGVFLLRPDSGRRPELIYPHRFLGPRATELQWLEKARRSGWFRIKVRLDPNHLDRIWYLDDMGIHELLNVASDVDFVRKATLVDTLTMQDEDVENRELSRQTTDQARTDFVVARSVADDAYQREKKKEIESKDKRPSKASMTRDVKKNREEEKNRLALESTSSPVIDHDSPSDQNPISQEPDWMESILSKHRNVK